jgi:type I restriction enzyme S subunit
LNPPKSTLDLPLDTEVSFVPMDAVGELGGLELNETRPLEEVYNGYTYFADGDICLAKITPCFENGKGALAQGLTNGVAFGTTELHVIRPLPGLDPQFLFYVTTAHDFRSLGEAEMLGAGGQKRVPEEFLKDWRPPLPPLETQRRIARFLDEKTAQIDGLVQKKRALLGHLAEKRQALITGAVTKGLNPAAPMKSSGIDWLGDIPAHWEVLPLKRVLRSSTYGISESLEPTGEVAVLRMGNLVDGEIDFGDLRFLDRIDESLLLEVGDVVFNRTNSLDLVGKASIFRGDVEFPVSLASYLVRFRFTDRYIPEYANFVMGIEVLLALARALALPSIGQANLNPSRYALIEFPIPPIAEQEHIIGYLVEQIGRVRTIKDQVTNSLQQLSEYRAALITSAVTGNIVGLR